ncbi:MAG: hypothetical protein ACI815_001760 [Psychroserpens sp.]|jgi:hypothetical protein
MKKTALLFTLALFLYSCAESQFYESTWIDQDTEKSILNIEEKNGKLWLNNYGRSDEIVIEGSRAYIKHPNYNVPLTIDSKKDILTVRGVHYILLQNSLKGKFTGKWKNENEDLSFLVQIDENIDLNWDMNIGANKPIRYYPKPTEGGFHFTIGQDTLSYKIVDGLLIDNKGNKYSKDSKIN